MKSQVLNLLFKILGVGQMYYKIQNIFRFKKMIMTCMQYAA